MGKTGERPDPRGPYAGEAGRHKLLAKRVKALAEHASAGDLQQKLSGLKKAKASWKASGGQRGATQVEDAVYRLQEAVGAAEKSPAGGSASSESAMPGKSKDEEYDRASRQRDADDATAAQQGESSLKAGERKRLASLRLASLESDPAALREASALGRLYQKMSKQTPGTHAPKESGPADPASIKDPQPDIDEAEQVVVTGLVREAQSAKYEAEDGPAEGRAAAYERAASKLKEAADHSEKHGDAKAAAKLRETAGHVEKKRAGGDEVGEKKEAEPKSEDTGPRGGRFYITPSGKKVYLGK